MVNEDLIKKEISNIKHAKYKYFFIGLIVGIIPYTLILLLVNNISYSTASFKQMIFVFGIITTIVNGFAISNMASNKLKDYFNLKYNITYEEIKNELI